MVASEEAKERERIEQLELEDIERRLFLGLTEWKAQEERLEKEQQVVTQPNKEPSRQVEEHQQPEALNSTETQCQAVFEAEQQIQFQEHQQAALKAQSKRQTAIEARAEKQRQLAKIRQTTVEELRECQAAHDAELKRQQELEDREQESG
ncbi:hypothetical protein QBC40DRAFT_248750 [Triangularia verruculosa]|uniref:Uncharacterized protein n=1 Tax=Triangularia verruculosa TaxID=2587418 RepID=A0AAN6XXQ9_9PEZI|nr:hypothetical protein QBC40DRAFT_248750 [Triangularia verruculosa]